MTALRDDPVGASSRGIDVVRTKSIAFCVSCALCGLAGSLYGTFSQLVSPELGLLQQTGLVLAMVVIGGMSSLTGAVAGAILVYLSSEWMRGFGNVQIIVFALLVIVFARYLPGGPVGARRAAGCSGAAREPAVGRAPVGALRRRRRGRRRQLRPSRRRDPRPDRPERLGQDDGAQPALGLSRAALGPGADGRRRHHRLAGEPAGAARRAADVPDDARLLAHVGVRQPADRRARARHRRGRSRSGAPTR